MRVVVNALLEGGRAGGVQQGIVLLARALAATEGTDPSDLEVVFLTLEGLDDWITPELDGNRVRSQPVDRGTGRSAAAFLRRNNVGRGIEQVVIWGRDSLGRAERCSGTFEALKADVAHFPYQRAELTTVPMVYQPWDLQHRHLPQLFSRSTVRYREHTYRTYSRHARCVVAPTGFVKADLIAAYGLDPARVLVIPPYIWTPVVDHTPPEGLTGARTDPMRIRPVTSAGEGEFALYPARTWRHKNHRSLFAAIALARRSGIEVPLVCTGAPSGAEDELLRCAESLGIADLVRFTGYLTGDELDVLKTQARMLIFPSLFEGWGYPVIEAFESALPVACSRGEWLDAAAGDAALRFDPTDAEAIAEAMVELWTSPERRRERAERGLAHLRTFTATSMGNAYREVYERVGAKSIG